MNRLPISSLSVALLFVGLAPAGRAASAGAACRISLETAGRPAWSLEVSAEKITGDKTRLTVEDGTVYGFLYAQATRLRIGPDRIRGSLAGLDADLHVERSDEHALVRGPVGRGRLEARVGRVGLELLLGDLLVELYPVTPAPAGRQEFADRSGLVRLGLEGCGAALLRERPEVLLVVDFLIHHTELPLPIAPDAPPNRPAAEQ